MALTPYYFLDCSNDVLDKCISSKKIDWIGANTKLSTAEQVIDSCDVWNG